MISQDVKPLNVDANSTGEAEFSPRVRYRLQQINRAPPPKTTIAAVLLLLTGIIILSCGLSIWFNPSGKRDKGLSLIVLGSISTSLYYVPYLYVVSTNTFSLFRSVCTWALLQFYYL